MNYSQRTRSVQVRTQQRTTSVVMKGYYGLTDDQLPKLFPLMPFRALFAGGRDHRVIHPQSLGSSERE